jgi:hypothetical protein
MSIRILVRADQVRIEAELPGAGGKGIQRSKTSALARPYNRLLLEGKQIGRMNHIFFEDPSRNTYVLGSLCYTFTEMLLFFPALNIRRTIWDFSENAGRREVITVQDIDHISLEKNQKLWHVRTFRRDGERGDRWPDYRTELNPEFSDSFYWFGLSIRNPQHLEPKPKLLVLDYFGVQEKSTRLKALKKAWPSAEVPFHNVTLNDSSIQEGEFLHFDFYIGPEKTPDGVFATHQPTHLPLVTDGMNHNGLPLIPQRSHPVLVPDMKDRVWIVSSKHKGNLSEEAIIGGLIAESK